MGNQRIAVYFTGFLIGMLLVTMLLSRRAAREQAGADPWISHNAEMVAAGAMPLPESVHPSIRKGLILDYGLLPVAQPSLERVWLLKFQESYPNVRVVEDLESGNLAYMAADQIKITLAEGVDVTELKPMLDELGLRLRMFNRREKIAVLGLLHTGLSAVPDTLAALQPWAKYFDKAEPDWILFKGE